MQFKVDDITSTTEMNKEELLARINERITDGDVEKKPDELYEPIRYILSAGGKRLRPLLTLFGCYLFSGETEKALLPGIGVELFHTFTLVHDDIMDKAPLRRGNETVHRKWDQNVAILSGDTMLFKAYEYLIRVEDQLIREVITLFNQCAIEVCEGQQYDMNFETRDTVSEKEYLSMIQSKTAAVLGFSLQLGAIIGGAERDDAETLRDFGINMGIGFQLKDDLLDVFGDAGKFGKQVGGDIIANKKTYLLIKAFELASESQKEELRNCLKGKMNDHKKVARVTEIYKELGIKELTDYKINNFFEIAFSHLEKVNCPEGRKEQLADFTQTLMNREN